MNTEDMLKREDLSQGSGGGIHATRSSQNLNQQGRVSNGSRQLVPLTKNVSFQR